MSIYRVTVGLTWNGVGSPGANVWHYRADGSQPAIGMEEDVADGLANLHTFYNSIRVLYPSTTSIRIPEDVLRIDTDPPQSVGFAPQVLSGTGFTTEAPELLAMCVQWLTSVRTRRGRGRTFIGPLSSGTIETDGTPDNAKATTLQTAARALVAAGEAGDANGAFGVYSRVDSVIRDFTDATARQDKFAVMKSRRD